MSTRTLAVFFCASLLCFACGGEEESGPECMGMQMSMPGQPGDPCPQNDAMCVAAGGKAYAICVDGKWADKCDCIVAPGSMPSGPSSGGPIGMTSPVCGDNTISSTEQCDRTNLNGMTCQSLGYNGGGTLLCNQTTCMYDTIMCRMSTGMPSGAGTSGGAGMGGGGTGS